MVRMAAILTAFLSVSFPRPLQGQEGGEPQPAAPSPYVGSAKCAECHQGEYNHWKLTPHASMARVPDWTGSDLLRQLASTGLPFPRENVHLVIGNLKKLVFLTRNGPDLVALPRQYNITLRRWEDFTEHEWEPPLADAEQGTHAEPVSWTMRCAGCHTTGYNPTTSQYVELSVGCEECHGPGARHSQTTNKNEIINPRSLPHEEAISVCGQCHSRGVSKDGAYPFSATFVPGDLLSDHSDVLQFTPGANTEAFWGNGMARRHHQQYQEFMESKHYRVGLACFDCHEGHRFRLTAMPTGSRALWARTEMVLLAHRSHSVCVRCHTGAESEFVERITTSQGPEAPRIMNVEQHSRHPLVLRKMKPGGVSGEGKLLCNDCHMPLTAPPEFGYPMHTHTFRAPQPEATERYGVPNACNQCHTDKSSAWAREQCFLQWVSPRLLAEFEGVEAEYSRLSLFLSDAEPSARARVDAASDVYRRAHDLLNPLRRKGAGGKTSGGPALLRVADNVKAIDAMLSELTSLVSTCKADTKTRLDGVLETGTLEALNHVLRAQQLPVMSPPPLAETYGESVVLYRAFNETVQERGRALFDGAGRRTSWKAWVEIHQALSSPTVRALPDHDVSELEEMGLVRKSLTLER